MSYSPKDLIFEQEGRDKLKRGISQITNAVKSTLGPLGKTVLMESANHTQGMTVTKDGVTVAKAIDLEDPVENLAVRMMKEAADKTASSAGDGTTTAIVLTEALIRYGMKLIEEGENINTSELIREIKILTDQIIKDLSKASKKVTKRTLKDVATVSANNSPEIGKLISDTYKELGPNGVLTVEKSINESTYYEVTNGIKIQRGYTSPLFINNQRKDECILEDVHILITDTEIQSLLEIENILKPIINQKKKLLIIGNCSTNVINTLAANVVQNNLSLCNIIPPSFGYKTNELLTDIALAVGGKYFSESQGDDLSLLDMSSLGFAKKIIIGKDKSVIIKKELEDEEKLIERIAELKVQGKSNALNKNEKDFVLERIANLCGSVGVIYVGANSEIEQKEKFDRIEDAVCAVRSALEEGILPGGGVALLRIGEKLGDGDASDILYNTLCTPLEQILINAGEDVKEIRDKICNCAGVPENFGYNVKTKEFGDMFKMGIIDPAKVTKNALINAVSVATTILSTNAIVTMKRK
jgi:chaperonin GroEL